MKNYIKNSIYVLLASSIMLVQGCGDYFNLDDNPNLVTQPSVNSLLSTVTHKTGMNSYNVAYINTFYAQYFASPGIGTPGDTYQITNTSGTWNAVYYAMADLHDMIAEAEKVGATLHSGVGKTLMAYHVALVTDTWGAGPYSDAFGKTATLTPTYDSEEQLYNTSLDLINAGIADLSSTSASVTLTPTQDLIHGGNVSAWLKTAYAIKARLLNKVSKKSSYDAQAVLTAIDNSYQSNADDATMGTFSGRNSWASTAISNLNNLLGGWLSDNFINHLNGDKYGVFDPRIEKIATKTITDTYVGTRNGQGNIGAANTVHDESYINYLTSPVTGEASPFFIITYPEMKFVEAEAAFRSGNRERAYSAYLKGIEASMSRLQVAAADRDAYISSSSVSVGESALTLYDIFREKYVATYLNSEGWNDVRRFDYQYTDFRMPVGAATSNFIRRVSIPNDELSRNTANVPAEVPLDTPLWWDQP